MLELSIRLQEILFTMTKDQVHEVLRHYMNEKGLLLGGGLELLGRLIEVYGRKPLQTATLPYTFDWSSDKLNVCWNRYKIKLQEDNFFETHPSLTSTAIAYAKKGFEKHEIGPRLLDYIRTELGEGHEFTWDEFCNKVERFLGDPYRRKFNNLTLDSKICDGMIGFDNPKDYDPASICQIKNYKDSPNQYPHIEFLQKVAKVIKKASKKNVNKTKSGKRIPPICGWCGKNHPTYLCLKPRTKWMNHRCTNCKGLGHPKTVCTSPSPNNEAVESEKRSVFVLTTPEGIYKINIPMFETKKKTDKWLMIDSGAAISVAPLKEFSSVELNKKK